MLCLGFVALPISCLLAFRHDYGVEGLWVGYGASGFLLTALYYVLMACINWKTTAKWASTDEDCSTSDCDARSTASSDEPLLNKTLISNNSNDL